MQENKACRCKLSEVTLQGRGSVWSWALSGSYILDHYARHGVCSSEGGPAHLPLECCCTERERRISSWVFRHKKMILPLVFISFASPLSVFNRESAAIETAFRVALGLVYSIRVCGWRSTPLTSPYNPAMTAVYPFRGNYATVWGRRFYRMLSWFGYLYKTATCAHCKNSNNIEEHKEESKNDLKSN